MKILKKIKWGIGASILVVVMGSCVKDPDFGMTNAVWYMLQKNVIQGADTTATFAPYIQLAANEQLSRVVVSSKSFPQGVPGKIVNYYFWESNVQSYEFTDKPEVENYTISATNGSGAVASHSFSMGMNLDKVKPLGFLKTEFAYDEAKGLTVKWNAVQGAIYYELWTWSIKKPEYKVRAFTLNEGVKELNFSNYDAQSKGFEAGGAYGFELVAYMVVNGQIQIKLVPEAENRYYVESWKRLH